LSVIYSSASTTVKSLVTQALAANLTPIPANATETISDTNATVVTQICISNSQKQTAHIMSACSVHMAYTRPAAQPTPRRGSAAAAARVAAATARAAAADTAAAAAAGAWRSRRRAAAAQASSAASAAAVPTTAGGQAVCASAASARGAAAVACATAAAAAASSACRPGARRQGSHAGPGELTSWASSSSHAFNAWGAYH